MIMNWIPITNLSEVPTDTRVLLTVQSLKFKKLDAVISATITEENGKRTVKFHTSDVVMYDISKDMIDCDGEYADTLIITAYMNYPEPYKPKNNETDEQNNLITPINKCNKALSNKPELDFSGVKTIK